MKFLSVAAKVFHADRQSERKTDGWRMDGGMDGRTNMTELIVPFRGFANALKIGSQCHALFHVIYLPVEI
jgi:hypothetical protein